ncbi:hypothetical protein SAMN05421636_10228 [Pricia antarctica]|uniref:HEAT repeat domain-containing protein n=1 Tax=Pricia antarctica TaxID=641691 RepID=A0A1G6XZ05_9FLAO|nr:hypothetical protein [Pricia antarctica]SDD82616.1 hypothetical protein SAMN05421636_10228 [Pricia antarctica]
MLKSKNNIVRYWAIFGLRSQKKEILEPYKKEIFNANYDSYPPISVTALAIFYQFFTNPEAENKLKEFCKNSNMDITLIAINYLL